MPVPVAQSIRIAAGHIAIDRTDARMDPSLEPVRDGVIAMLTLGETNTVSGGAVVRFRHNASFAQERYLLSVGAGGVCVEAGGSEAAVHAAATIAQIMAEHDGALPFGLVEDESRFGWRGLLLDVCRHFFPMSTIYRFVDLMAYYKYNRLHLHLSEDQGFRFESERFPLLNTVGSWRASTQEKHNGKTEQDGARHGGYYTKAELRDLVAYAKARGIEIVPEIDIPGHALSILAAYPALSCFHEPVEVATRFGVMDFSKILLCAGSEETYDFLFSLLDEVMAIFPFSYVHIGGDEAVKDNWKRCEKCQSLRRAQGLKNERELQGYFLNRVIAHLEQRGRRAIVWNDGLSKTLTTSAIAQYWTPFFIEGRGRTARHIRAGGQAIMSAYFHTYNDLPYAMVPLKAAYEYEPVFESISGEQESNIRGVEAALWTEWIDTEEKLFFNLLPRLAATAEAGWAKKKEPYRAFLKRLPPHYALYERLGLTYAKHTEKPQSLWKRIAGTITFLSKETHAELNAQKREANCDKGSGK